MKTVGIIGFGSFGRFLAEKLSPHMKVMVYSRSQSAGSWSADLDQVASADYLVLAVPLQSYETVVNEIKPHLRADTTIVDVCSVKSRPINVLRDLLPEQPLVATHPMFGSESASVRFDGHTMIMCPEVSSPQQYTGVKSFAESLGLAVIEMTCDEHDEEIAIVQGLTFFIARSLNNMGIHNQKLHTPSFQRLLDIADLEKHHSADLFDTIQSGNAHTSEVRKRFMSAASRLDQNISGRTDSTSSSS